ncbi:hypothetical protein PP175_06690 [Aneurinibacillus sp. Ricciae_BoGa-3]|uniref:hypothetical protein n=1 Tax=Aneurinibacillus sp. Ricciae_BoGa-3 TaxID=3022697 RepID=UPI00233F9C95|nr:hypothetical protein [Aneurinibacillus sp. Ricciae_BoGa-3]WCK55623.1 hypothetical protein PP175_06690 [Aneurinibacillus sp. Ricciae_BoGa-3]
MMRLHNILGAFLILGLVGCSNTHTDSSVSKSTDSPSVKQTVSSINNQLKDSLQHALAELSTIEQDVKSGKFDESNTIFSEYHAEFHSVIYPAIISKKGQKYADGIHSNCDELETALNKKEPSSIIKSINTNKKNLQTVAGIYGIPLT